MAIEDAIVLGRCVKGVRPRSRTRGVRKCAPERTAKIQLVQRGNQWMKVRRTPTGSTATTPGARLSPEPASQDHQACPTTISPLKWRRASESHVSSLTTPSSEEEGASAQRLHARRVRRCGRNPARSCGRPRETRAGSAARRAAPRASRRCRGSYIASCSSRSAPVARLRAPRTSCVAGQHDGAILRVGAEAE